MVASRGQSPRGPRGAPDRGRTSLHHRSVMFAGSGLPCRTKTCVIRCVPLKSSDRGEVREWTNRHAWKACVSATGPWVRIPPSPPYTTTTRSIADTSLVVEERRRPTSIIGAGPCAIEPCESRQVRKEATVSGPFCVPQDHLAPLFNDVSGAHHAGRVFVTNEIHVTQGG